MGNLIIRDLDDALIVQLKRRAWYQGLPFEEAMRRLVIASVEYENDEFERVPMLQPSYYMADGKPAGRRAPLYS